MEQALYQAAVLTFEELAYVFPVEGGDLKDLNLATSQKALVGFQGTFSGELLLRIEDDALEAMALNILGDDEPLNEEMIRDVLGELANVICGNALPTIAGKRKIFRLSAPDFNRDINPTIVPSATARVGMEEGRADVSIYLN